MISAYYGEDAKSVNPRVQTVSSAIGASDGVPAILFRMAVFYGFLW